MGTGISRRSFLQRGAALGSAALGAPALLAACGGSDEAGGGGGEKVTLTFVSWGGGYQKAETQAWLEPFMTAHPNITIVQDQPTDYAKLKTMVESGNVTWDVVDVGNDFGLESSRDLLEPLDCATIACDESAEGMQNSKWRVGIQQGTYQIAFRTDKLGGKAPQGWRDFYDVDAFPGKRAHWQFVSGGVLESALLADGVEASGLYPLDVDRALRKLDTIKDQLVWWQGGAQASQLLASGEVSLAGAWTGRALDVKKQGKPVELQWNEGLAYGEYVVVPKGSKHVKQAMQLVAWMASPEHNVELAKRWAVAPANKTAVARLPADLKSDRSTGHVDQVVPFDDMWWDENFAEADKKFKTWLSG